MLPTESTNQKNVTLPTIVKWMSGTAPTPNSVAGKIDVFRFTTPDAGATWFGSF